MLQPKRNRTHELNTNPNRLPNESLESYKHRQKYNDFRIRQEEDKYFLKREYNKINDSQNKDPNIISKTIRKTLTSPLHLASYLHDKINTNDTDKFRSDNRKIRDNVKGLFSALDATSLLFPFSPKQQAVQGMYDKVAKSVPSLTKQLGTYLGIQALEGVVSDKSEDYIDKKIENNYAMGGNINTHLNQFNQGGTHEQNPLGGIPMGQNASVEQGETMKGNFIYSDRVILTPDIIGSLGLPKALVGKTASEASKIVNKKFEDRSDNISESTKTSLLDKIAQAQEAVKAQEQEQLQQAMEANSTMAPEDQMNGQIPQGMEEYLQPEQEQLPTEQLSVDPSQMAYGGRVKLFTGGNVGTMGSIFQGVGSAGNNVGSGGFEERYNYDPKLKEQYKQMETVKDGVASAFGPWGQAARGVEKLGKSIGTSVGGETGGDIASGILDPFSGQMETFKNKDSTTGEKIAAVAAPFLSGVIASAGRRRTARRLEGIKNNNYFNTVNSDFAYGGEIDPPTKITKEGLKSTSMLPNTNMTNQLDRTLYAVGEQSGVKHGPLGESGHYLYYGKMPGDTGFDPRRNREFVNEEGYRTYMQSPQGQQYRRNIAAKTAQPIEQLALGGALNTKIKYADGGYYDNNRPYFMTDPGKISGPEIEPSQREQILPVNQITPAKSTYQPKTFLEDKSSNNKLYNGNPYIDKMKLMLRDNKIGSTIKDNIGEALTYAPVLSNALQLKNLKKPEVVNAIRNDRRFKYDPVDTRSQLNIAQSEMDNTVNALSNANMSQGALSNSILAAGLNKNKVLSDAYFNAANQNNAMKMQGQSFDNALDEANIARQINADEATSANRGVYESAKSKLIADLGTNVGKIGKGIVEDKMVRELFGYTKSGKYYIKHDGSIATPEELTKAINTIKGVNTKDTKAKGGYIRKYRSIL